MTFPSVLNSLIVTTEGSTRSQIAKYLQTAGIVAGALVGLGPVVHEFGSLGYVTAVATTAVLLPEVRHLLEPDLMKYIKNNG